MRLLDQADDLELLGGGVPHSSSPPSAIMLFLSSRSSSACSATTSFSVLGLAAQILDLVAGRRTRGVAGEPPLAGFQELLRPAVVQALGDAFAAAQLGDAVLAAQAIQHDADLLFGRVVLPRRPADVLDDLFGRQVGGVADFCLIFAP